MNHPSNNQTLSPRQKRLIYRASYTGTRETDLLLGAFARAHVADFDAAQLARFEALLEAGDQQIFAWATGRAAVPGVYDHDVMQMLKNFKIVLE
jgi:antitoxin CptB